MTNQVEISIPSFATASDPKPHTVYNISLRLPLRSFAIQKRYSDFTTLHRDLTSQTHTAPPFPLPSKSFFTSSTSSLALAESRRSGLEAYLRSINTADSPTWRNTSAWRTFLNLPSTATNRSHAASNLHSALTTSSAASDSGGTATADPVVWLDQHRELKTVLHEARLEVTKRDQASTAQSQHEAAAAAKKRLLRAGTLVAQLEQGLRSLESGSAWGSKNGQNGAAHRLGEGELRRRKDLLSSATREKEGLDNLLSAMAAKSALDRTVANVQEEKRRKGELGAGGESAPSSSSASTRAAPTTKGRVLGRETERTKALDNQGVLQLQQQLVKEQDEDVSVLAQAVARQKELGLQIQEELAVQDDMLNLLDEDVDRVQGKINVARKRVDKIS